MGPANLRPASSVFTNTEYEIDSVGILRAERTGMFRRRQYYAGPGDQSVPSQRKKCEWRVPKS